MKVIAYPFMTLKGPAGQIRVCTDEQYNKLNMEEVDKINSHTIPFSFFKDYVEYRGKKIEVLEGKMQEQEYGFFKGMWLKSSIITVVDARKLLHLFDLPYDEFIKIYCEYLLEVNFL